MGRPLASRFFGNRNTTGIGGEGVASVVLNALGAYTTRPVFTFTAPELPGGTTATGTITSEAHTAVVSGTQTAAYQVGQVLSVGANGATFTAATLEATGLLTTVAITGIAGEFSCDAAALYVGQSVTISGTFGGTGSITGYVDPTTYYIKTTNGSTTFTLVSTYAAAITGTGGDIVTTAGTPTGLTYTTNSSAAPLATVSVTARGSYEALVSGAQATTVTSGGAGALLTITYRAKAVVITLAGSGYSAAPTATPTESVTFTSVTLTAAQINAINISATVTGGTIQTSGDIVKQLGSRRYKVRTSDGYGICTLVSVNPAAEGQMTITATDSVGGTYYVIKLTRHKATLIRNTGTEFADNQAVSWNFTGAVLNTSVLIANA